ncbi:MAG: potassium channel family protein [Pseudomonadota bacterium]
MPLIAGMLIECLLISGLLVIATALIHFIGLAWLSAFLRRSGHSPATITSVVLQGLSILFVVLMLFALHAVEVLLFAIAYIMLGEFNGIEEALYFSASTFTTVGFGDLYLESEWRMLAAMESMNGFLLIGWSTAFLVSVTARIRLFEIDVDRLDG